MKFHEFLDQLTTKGIMIDMGIDLVEVHHSTDNRLNALTFQFLLMRVQVFLQGLQVHIKEHSPVMQGLPAHPITAAQMNPIGRAAHLIKITRTFFPWQ